MQQLVEAIKRHAAGVMKATSVLRWGFVRSVDPTTPAVRVEFQPEGVLSGWLPLLLPSAGTDTTDFAWPVEGAQVAVTFDGGNAEHGVALGYSHNNSAPMVQWPGRSGVNGTHNDTKAPPLPGERIIVACGSVFRLNADGSIFLSPANGILMIDGQLEVNGDIIAQNGVIAKGNVTAGYGGDGSVTLQHHKHPTAALGGPSEPTPGS